MPISVRDLYNQICDNLLEPSALTGDVLTDTQFISALNQVIGQFLELGAYIKPVINVTVQDQSIYESEGPVSVIKNLAVDHIGIPMNSGFYWDQSDAYWQNNPSGEPREWVQDRLEVQGFEVRPAPDWNGYTVGVSASFYGTISSIGSLATNFTIQCVPTAITGLLGTISECDYGAVYVDCSGPMYGTIAEMRVSDLNMTQFALLAPQYTITDLDEYLQDIAPSFLPYLRLNLHRIITSDNAETKNTNANKYLSSRVEEGASLVAAITSENRG